MLSDETLDLIELIFLVLIGIRIAIVFSKIDQLYDDLKKRRGR